MNQRNNIADALEDGRVAFGAQTVTHSPILVEAYGRMGLDFVWIDFEHAGPSPYDSNVFEQLTRAADVTDTELIVRLPNGEPSLIRKVLDSGVRNLVIPRVETAEHVEQAVEATRFDHDGTIGERGVGAGRVSNWGLGLDEEYHRGEDRSILLGVMIENLDAVNNLDEILSVPDLGFVFIGPHDLAVSAGHPLEPEHPSVRRTVEEIRELCETADVPVLMRATDVSEACDAIQNGSKLIRLSGHELSLARDVIGRRLERIKSELP